MLNFVFGRIRKIDSGLAKLRCILLGGPGDLIGQARCLGLDVANNIFGFGRQIGACRISVAHDGFLSVKGCWFGWVVAPSAVSIPRSATARTLSATPFSP